MLFHCHSRLHQKSAAMLAGNGLRIANSHMIACCDYAAGPLMPYVDQDRACIVYNGVRPMNGGCTSKRSTRIRKIGVIGRIEVEKGQLQFVRAAKKIMTAFPDCQFKVVGSALFSDDTYLQQVKMASTDVPIEFVGWQQDPSKTFEELDLLVVPSSRAEATTRVILEAYSAGLPVVAFPSGGIPEVLKDGETGFLAADQTDEALARRIICIVQMEHSKVAAVVNRAKKEWRTKFSLDVYRQQICTMLDGIERELTSQAGTAETSLSRRAVRA
jgi:glycosyltransferase involved in cell wall biosynthesis